MVNKMVKDIFSGWTRGEAIYGWSLMAIQVLFYMFYPDSLWGFIAGVSGTACVLLVAKGKISNYFFGFIQTGIMMVLGFQVGLIGETGENIFYFVSQFWGIKSWKDNLDSETDLVLTRKFNLMQWLLTIGIISTLTYGLGSVFTHFNGTQPFLDSLTLVVALVAQVLMVLRYREQWALWIVLNVVSVYQWLTLGNMSLFALYLAFTINSLYGLVKWSKQQKQVVELVKEI